MAEYLIQGETLKNIADAIRSKTGRTDKIAVTDMAKAISEITGGAAEPVLVDLTVTENGIYTPGEGIDGYSSVTVAIEGATGWGGTLTDTLSWELGTTGTLAIVGTGAMPDYTAEYQPWLVHKDIIKDIIILSGVTHIGRYAFYNCANLETVTIPTSVKFIRDNAFNAYADYPNPVGVYIKSLYSWCNIDFDEYGYGNPIRALKNLYVNGELVTDLVIPSDVFSVPDNAFVGCSMTSLSFQRSTCRIGKSAFSNCQQLKNVTLPSDLTEIPKSAFGLCASLQSIVIPDKVTTIGNLAFFVCTLLKEVTIGSGVTKIVASAFTTDLTSLTFKVTDGWKVYNDATGTTLIKVFASTELDDPAEAAVAFNQYLNKDWKRT